MVDWSDDRIAALSDQDLKNLLVNAERKSAAEVVAQCKAEMEKRDAAKHVVLPAKQQPGCDEKHCSEQLTAAGEFDDRFRVDRMQHVQRTCSPRSGVGLQESTSQHEYEDSINGVEQKIDEPIPAGPSMP